MLEDLILEDLIVTHDPIGVVGQRVHSGIDYLGPPTVEKCCYSARLSLRHPFDDMCVPTDIHAKPYCPLSS